MSFNFKDIKYTGKIPIIVVSILLLFLLIIVIFAYFNKPEKKLIHQAELNRPIHVKDLGEVNENEPAVSYNLYLFNNYSDRPVKIVQAKTSCACLNARLDDKLIRQAPPTILNFEIPANRKKVLEVNYNPRLRRNKKEKYIEESILLQTDNEENKLVTIKFKAEID